MGLFNFPEVFAEMDLLDSIENRVRQFTAAKSFLNPGRIARTAALAQVHPTLPPALVTAGLMMDLGDWPSLMDIATRAAVIGDQPNYDHRVSSQQTKMTTDRMAKQSDGFYEPGNSLYDNPMVKTAYSALKGTVRTGFTMMDSLFDEVSNATIRGGVRQYQAMRESGVNPAIAGLMSLNDAAPAPMPWLPVPTGMPTPTKFAYEGVRNQERGKSPVALGIKNYLDGNPSNNRINLGSGFFPSQDENTEGLTDAQYEIKYGLPINTLSQRKREELQIGGLNGTTTSVSPGRLIFNNVVEPGTNPHKLLSGLTDIAYNLVADPTDIIGGQISKMRHASKSFRSAAGVFDPLNEEAGLIFKGLTQRYGGKKFGKSIVSVGDALTENARAAVESGTIDNLEDALDEYPIKDNQYKQYRAKFFDEGTGNEIGSAAFSYTNRGIEVFEIATADMAGGGKSFVDDVDTFFDRLSRDMDEDIIGTAIINPKLARILQRKGWEELPDFLPVGMKGETLTDIINEAEEVAMDLHYSGRRVETPAQGIALRKPRPYRVGPRRLDPLRKGRTGRGTIDGVEARSWMNSKDGAVVATAIANRSNITEIRRLLPDVKDRKLLRALQLADNPNDVKQLLLPQLGTTVHDIPFSGGLLHRVTGQLTPTVGELGSFLPFVDKDLSRIAGFTPAITRQFRSTKLGKYFERMPGTHLSANSLDDAFEEVDSWMRNVGFDDELREKHLRNWSQIQDGNGTQMYGAARQLMADSAKRMVDTMHAEGKLPFLNGKKKRSTTNDIIKSVHRLFDTVTESSLYFTDAVGDPAWFPGARVHDASGKVMPTPHALSEHLSGQISIPKAQDINRVMGRLARYGQVKSIEPTALARLADNAMAKVWKPAVLLSVAWPLKVIGEEQVRMWFEGLSSVFNNPYQALAAITLGKFDPKGTMKAYDIMGNDLKSMVQSTPAGVNKLVDQYRSALSMRHGGYLGQVENVDGFTRVFRKVYKDQDPDFYKQWANVELRQMASDDIIRQVAREGVEATKEWFWSGSGQSFRRDLASAIPEDGERLLESKEFADLFIESYNARLHIKTGGKVDILPGQGYTINKPGHQGLIDTISNGRFNYKGKNYSIHPMDESFDNELFAQLLEESYSDYAPSVVKGAATSRLDKANPGSWQKGIDALFSIAMSKPTNFLSRSPAFDQRFWEKVQDLAPHIHSDEARRILSNQLRTNTKGTRAIDWSAPKADLELSIKEVEEIAGSYAAEHVKKLLYDNSHPLRWAELSRNILPFAEAWWEVGSTWMRLMAENPHKIRRLQQGIGGARREGFIQVDPETGEQYYSIPGAGMLQEFFGLDNGPVSNQLTGSADSLNPLKGGYMPGFGPLVQIPMGLMMPEESDWDWARELVAPYGVEKIADTGDLLETGVPPAIRKVFEAAAFDEKNNSRQAGMVAEIYNQLLLHGEVEQTPEGHKAALDRARKVARRYDMIRAVGSSLIPGTPRLRQVAKDNKGKWTLMEAIASNYMKTRDKDGEEAADDWLDENFALVADDLFGGGATYAVRKRPVTGGAYAFLRDHPEFYDKFPETAYYMFPDDPTEEMEYEAWEKQFEDGNRVILTPEQQQFAKEQSEAYDYRNEAIAVLADSGINPRSEQGREIMRALDEYLKSEYPAYGKENVGTPTRANEEQILDELRGWSDMRGPFTDTQHYQDVVDFMALYDGIQQAITTETGLVTLSSSTNERVVEARELLYEFGEDIASRNSQFRQLWSDHLMYSVLTSEDTLGQDQGAEPFEILERRLMGMPGYFEDSESDFEPGALIGAE